MPRRINEDDRDQRPSRTQKKRDATALQELGALLAELSDERLIDLDLPDELAEALAAYKPIRSHEAKRRLLQYIGKLMRFADIEPIEAALAELDVASREQAARLHEVELVRARLIAADGPDLEQALDEALAARPGAVRARLAKLVADAKAEREAKKSPRAFRLLFKYLRDAATVEHAPEV